MSMGIRVRQTVALGLSALLFGPSVELLAAQDAPRQNQQEKQQRRQRQVQKQQEQKQARQHQQQERRQQREAQAERRQDRTRQQQEQRQRGREQRVERQQQRAQQVEQDRRNRAQGRSSQVERQNDGLRRQRQSERAQAAGRAQQDVRRRQVEVDRPRSRGDARSRRPEFGGDRAVRRGERLPEARRGEIIRENQERSRVYGRSWQRRERVAQERTRDLQRHRRVAHARYQQRYLDRLRYQWRYDNDWRRYDYNRDPYFWSPAEYRYRYGGRYYEINRYGADLLREAVNHGYEEGFLAGQADREDRWRGDYRDSYVYEDASYGYRGLYVDEDQYNYYFRQGFERGYQDGYRSRYEYGRRIDGKYKVLAGVLAGILIFEALR